VWRTRYACREEADDRGEAHDSSSCPSVVPLLLRRKVAAEVEDEGNVSRRGGGAG
jgi:hypothetical protein